jgi:hypothetical protein
MACKEKPFCRTASYGLDEKDPEWLDVYLNNRFVTVLNDVVYPGRRFGARLLRPDGEVFRKQEMPFNVVAHLLAVHARREWCVLDPFGGTGVVGMAGIRLGMAVTVVEKFDDVVDAAEGRWHMYHRWMEAKTGGIVGPTPAEFLNPYCWSVLFASSFLFHSCVWCAGLSR